MNANFYALRRRFPKWGLIAFILLCAVPLALLWFASQETFDATINAASRERIVARTITIGVCIVLGWLFGLAWLAVLALRRSAPLGNRRYRKCTGNLGRFDKMTDIHRTHSEVLADYLSRVSIKSPVIVEVGVGITSATIAKYARPLKADYYACDLNAELIAALQESISPDRFVRFMVGDSEVVLSEVIQGVSRVDFAFLDGAASAMRTFREFTVLEPKFRPGSVLVMDNAAIPEHRGPLRSLCRKGKIVVPYLLASPLWEVISHPCDGDSMVAAIMHEEPIFADNAYEDIHNVFANDPEWRRRVPQSK